MTTTKMRFYFTVVEQAGYVGEQDVRTCFSTAQAALAWRKRHYGADEIESMHVEVRKDFEDGSQTYDF
ncbi:MAG TPA: hypothetical protein VKB76_09385 [Ktedonobacterales bacterium]|nr:hypothetical protein [Ktedonobacterales bacterium]